MIDAIYNVGLHLFAGSWWSGIAWPVVWNLIKIVVRAGATDGRGGLSHAVGTASCIGFHADSRHGAQPHGALLGLLQPIADVIKLLTQGRSFAPTAPTKVPVSFSAPS
jgi:NADH-quinone oxidoreductase subunit H